MKSGDTPTGGRGMYSLRKNGRLTSRGRVTSVGSFVILGDAC